MSDTLLEKQLIESAKNGDRQAFNELVMIYREPIVNLVYRFCGEFHLAEDAAQEAFVRAWKYLPAYHHKDSFRAWVYRIATNATLDMLPQGAAGSGTGRNHYMHLHRKISIPGTKILRRVIRVQNLPVRSTRLSSVFQLPAAVC